jgi:hypothetical protein
MVEETKESENSKGFHIFLLAIGIVGYFLSRFFGFFIGIGASLARVVFIFLIVYAIYQLTIGKKKEVKSKVYKEKSAPKKMKVHHIFYTIGVLFIFAAVWYFAREFIAELPDMIKLLLLIVSIIVTFFIAELLRGGDK